MKASPRIVLGFLGIALIQLGCSDSNSVTGPEGGKRTYSISGTVASGDSPIGGATVEVVGGQGVSASTNFWGEYNLVGVPAGTVRLAARASGYGEATRQVTVGPSVYEVDFDLVRQAAGTTRSSPPPLRLD